MPSSLRYADPMSEPRPATFFELLLALVVIVGLAVIVWMLASDENVMDD